MGVRNIWVLPQSQIRCLKADGKGKFTSAEGRASVSRAGEHSEREVCSVSISYASLPLTLMDGFVFPVFAIGYSGAHGVRVTLRQREQENPFEQYSSLRRQFEIRTSGDKHPFV
jgi:hypothetical protein